MGLEVSLHGAAREVGRSAVLVDTGKSKVLLDYGMKVSDEEGAEPKYPLPVHGFLDSVIVSHAHLDHSGAVPFLFQASEPTVFMHEASERIIHLLVEDSMKIARQKGFETYSRSHFKRMQRSTRTVKYGKVAECTPDVSFEMTDSGHILGAGMTRVFHKNIEMVYTGDFKDTDTRLHHGAAKPRKADVVITEGTYGNREHPDREESEKKFVEAIIDVTESGGSVLVPSFAVGRAQEILTILYSHRISVPVYLDGMAREVSEIYMEHPDLLRNYNEMYKSFKWANWISKRGERAHVFNEPSVVVTTAGMLSGGPAVYYLADMHSVKNSAVFLTGFQAPGTPGHGLLHKRKFSFEGVELGFADHRIEYFDFSAHADLHGIRKIIKAADPGLVIVNHCEDESGDAVVHWARGESYEAFAPKLREKFEVEKFLK
jgi:putative mRNA 3-end processing factor